MTKNFFDDQEEPLTPMAAPTRPHKNLSSVLDNKKAKKTALILIPLLICAVGAAYFFVKVIRAPKTYEGGTEVSEANPIIENTFVDLDPMIVNLSPSSTKQNFLKIAVVLHFSNMHDTKVAEAKLPLIIDSLQTFLRELRATDFNSTGSMLQLKEELLKRVNKITYPTITKEVLLKELVVN